MQEVDPVPNDRDHEPESSVPFEQALGPIWAHWYRVLPS